MSHTVSLRWATPNADKEIVYMARVSNPARQDNSDTGLLAYLIRKGHWSPFEMANICFEVNTTRDIGRQFLRHWTMRPQEFSQRYASVEALGEPVYREARLAHDSNRQASVSTDDVELRGWWSDEQARVWDRATEAYKSALDKGMAKEVARAVLPEGMTPSRLYFNAPIRTLLHLIPVRSVEGGAQKEAAVIADGIARLLADVAPTTSAAMIASRTA